jgi:hypothetical protein
VAASSAGIQDIKSASTVAKIFIFNSCKRTPYYYVAKKIKKINLEERDMHLVDSGISKTYQFFRPGQKKFRVPLALLQSQRKIELL